MACLRRVLLKCNEVEEGEVRETNEPAAANLQSLMEQLANAAKNPVKEKARVRMAPALKTMTLEGLDHDLWPVGTEADDLLDRCQKHKDKGVQYPCPFADLRKFVPAWCAGPRDKDDSDDEQCERAAYLCKTLGLPTQKSKPNISLLQWLNLTSNQL